MGRNADGKITRIWEAIETYKERKQPLIIAAGASCGQGSSRNWAAKGVEGLKRIQRTNLASMGILPIEFKTSTNRLTLGLERTPRTH